MVGRPTEIWTCMTEVARDRSEGTRRAILSAARERLLAEGYAALSTRKVAVAAAVPLSQLHYHFGSKQQLILSLLDEENRRRLDRQTQMYDQDLPLWQRYEQACDVLEDDLDSGYVRLLQEMIAAGWSNPAIGAGDAARLAAAAHRCGP
jgi:AcrR family transcriptional regulator